MKSNLRYLLSKLSYVSFQVNEQVQKLTGAIERQADQASEPISISIVATGLAIRRIVELIFSFIGSKKVFVESMQEWICDLILAVFGFVEILIDGFIRLFAACISGTIKISAGMLFLNNHLIGSGIERIIFSFLRIIGLFILECLFLLSEVFFHKWQSKVVALKRQN